MPFLVTSPSNSSNTVAIAQGWRRYRITLVDADTGEPIQVWDSYQRPEAIEELRKKLQEAVMPPDEYLEQVEMEHSTVRDGHQWTHTLSAVKNRAVIGGAPSGIHPETLMEYVLLVLKWHEYEKERTRKGQKPVQHIFCDTNLTSRARLNIARKAVQERQKAGELPLDLKSWLVSELERLKREDKTFPIIEDWLSNRECTGMISGDI